MAAKKNDKAEAPSTTPVKAVRFSSIKQADGDSVRRQQAAVAKVVAERGLTLDTSLSMTDLGISGWKGENAATGALSVFLECVRNGSIPRGSVLIVEALDRLTRETVFKALQLWLDLLTAGITIVTTLPEREYTADAKKPMMHMEPLWLFVTNNEKSETLSFRLKEAWAEKRKSKKPMTAWTPAWIRLKEDRSGFELIPEKAKIVRAIVQLATANAHN